MDTIALAIGCAAMIGVCVVGWFLHQFMHYLDWLLECHNQRLYKLEGKETDNE